MNANKWPNKSIYILILSNILLSYMNARTITCSLFISVNFFSKNNEYKVKTISIANTTNPNTYPYFYLNPTLVYLQQIDV